MKSTDKPKLKGHNYIAMEKCQNSAVHFLDLFKPASALCSVVGAIEAFIKTNNVKILHNVPCEGECFKLVPLIKVLRLPTLSALQ